LQKFGAAYPCSCTRKEISDSALNGIEGPVYPGTCRNGLPQGRDARAWRVRTDLHSSPFPLPSSLITFDDMLQGHVTQHLESDIGDFIVKRADGLFAYQLAVVVDDAHQGITHIVRGADLLLSTPRQIYLQKLLGFPCPIYMHLPVAINAQGEKLSKQTLAKPIEKENASATLFEVLEFFRQQPPEEIRMSSIEQIKEWAIANWQPDRLLNCSAKTINY